MRNALVLAAMLIVRVASAQPGAPADPPAPAPTPAPAPPADGAPAPTDGTPADAAPKADPDYGGRPDQSVSNPDSQIPGIRRGRDIVVRWTPDRSRENVILLSALGGAAIAFGAIGLYFHFDSRSASDEVSADRFTGRAWTPARQEIYDEAHRSKNITTVMYGVGGALLLATAIVYMVTEPKMLETVITPHSNVRRATTTMVAPTSGGAMVGRSWSF